MDIKKLRDLLTLAYIEGWNKSGEGWNAEYPNLVIKHPEWKKAMKDSIDKLLETPEAVELTKERDAALARVEEMEAAISSALSQHGVKFMDPPDGGDTPLVEQVCRMSQALLELEKPDPDYTQHPQIVGYARKKDLEPLLDPCMPDGGHIYIGLDHPSLWSEEPPYEFLTPLYTAAPSKEGEQQ